MAEPIEMLFGLRTLVGPEIMHLMGPDPLMGRGNFEGGMGRPTVIGTFCGHLCKNG